MKRMLLVFLMACWSAAAVAASGMTPDELAGSNEPRLVLDVRTPQEYAEGHIPGAINIPHDQVSADDARLRDWRDRTVVVYCRSGRRSAMAAEQLERGGFHQVRQLEGNFPGWAGKGLPVELALPAGR